MTEECKLASVSQTQGSLLSLTFWTVFLPAAGLFAVLSLGPRYAVQIDLRRRFADNEDVSRSIQSEIDHLTTLATALENDPDFVRRLADEEFRPTSPTETRFPVATGLNFDARVPAVSPKTAAVARPTGWMSDLFAATAEHSPLRRRLQMALIAVVLLSFACLNDAFFADGIGGRIRRALAWFAGRYRLPDDDAVPGIVEWSEADTLMRSCDSRAANVFPQADSTMD